MKHTYKTYALTVGLLLCLHTSAEAVILKHSSAVSGDTVTVGDVFNDSGIYAARYLAPAPAPGQPLHLTTHDLMRISKAFDLGWQPITGAENLVIRKISTTVSTQDIAYSVRRALENKIKGQKFDMQLASNVKPLHLPAGSATTSTVSRLRVDMKNGVFSARISAPAGQPVLHQQISGRIEQLIDIPVLKTPMRRDDIIAARDIAYIEMPASKVSSNTVVRADQMIGLSPRRGLRAMSALTPSDLSPPLDVKKGDLVTVVLQNGVMNMTLQGRALQNGSKGDAVRLVNTASNRTLEGVVTGPQTIELTLPSSKL